MGACVKKIRRVLAGNGGFTIVSVLCAFVILLIGISMFYGAIRVSLRLEQEARRMDQAAQRLLECYYEELSEGGSAAGADSGSDAGSAADLDHFTESSRAAGTGGAAARENKKERVSFIEKDGSGRFGIEAAYTGWENAAEDDGAALSFGYYAVP